MNEIESYIIKILRHSKNKCSSVQDIENIIKKSNDEILKSIKVLLDDNVIFMKNGKIFLSEK